MLNKLNIYKNALITTRNYLEKSLSFDEKNFLQLFKDKLKGNLSESGKIIYDSDAFKQSLKNAYKKFSDELTTEYLNLLDLAGRDASKTFDPHATVQKAQALLKKKLNELNTSLSSNLNNELITKDQNFDEEDQEELNKVLNNYTDDCEKKLNSLFQEMEGIWPKVAKFQLRIRNEAAALKTSNPNATFSVSETDLDKLSIGISPDPTVGWKIDTDNLKKILMHQLANQKPGEKFLVTLSIPDRSGIMRQVGDISFQYRSPAVALFVLILFYFLAIFQNNDVERMVKAFEKIIKEEGIAIDPNDISYTIKQLNTNGKWGVIKEKGPLSSEHSMRLQQANQELIENLKKEQKTIKKTDSIEDEGYATDSNSYSEEQTETPRPRF